MNHYLNASFLVVALTAMLVGCSNQEPSEEIPKSAHHALSTGHPLATQIGDEILAAGGNAFDAAVAVHFALATVYPQAGNIAGGGFAVYRLHSGEVGSLDFREVAPMHAHRDMYLDEHGDVIKDLSKQGILSVGVPGSVAGLYDMHQKFGVMHWTELLGPSIELARKGHVLTDHNAKMINKYAEYLYAENGPEHPFYTDSLWISGDTLFQPDLANTLVSIGRYGKKAFYEGRLAQMMVAESNKRGGLLTEEDLEGYQSIFRKPLVAEWDSLKIITMGPPSSGGIALIQLLNASRELLKDVEYHSPKHVHLMAEMMKRVYADRSVYLGDQDFFPVPVDSLLSQAFMLTQMQGINMNVTPSEALEAGEVEIIESHETTHYSIVDQQGNAVAVTTTLNGNFGSKVFVEGAGFLLNNQMDDFSSKPGVPNQFGLVGAEANAIEPGKRMLSSMTPCIVEINDSLHVLLGTPGGSTIITNVYQTIMNHVFFEQSLREAVDSRKIHHQWLPEKLYVEGDALSEITIDSLIDMGYELEHWDRIGHMNAVGLKGNLCFPVADTLRGISTGMGR